MKKIGSFKVIRWIYILGALSLLVGYSYTVTLADEVESTEELPTEQSNSTPDEILSSDERENSDTERTSQENEQQFTEENSSGNTEKSEETQKDTKDTEEAQEDEDTNENTEEPQDEEEEVSNHSMGEAASEHLVGAPNSTYSSQYLAPDQFNIGDKNYTQQDAIDVASYQSWMNSNDFKALYDLGVKGAVVKTTEATNYTNPYAASQINSAKNAGMKVSIYHYAHFSNYTTGYNEGKYAAQVLNNLGLEKNIQIFADMEDESTNKNTVKEGLNGFWKALDEAGYNNHNVYTYESYNYRDDVESTVGKAKTWIAQYPYSPIKGGTYEKRWENAGYGAWQFSSTALFRGNPIDVSIDYKGLLTSSQNGDSDNNPQGPYHKYGKYVTIEKNDYPIWQNFNWEQRSHSSNYYGETLEARGYYNHSNGSRYLSLYDNTGEWIGYINEDGTTINDNPQGDYHEYGEYVTINKDNYNIWQNFNWKKKSDSAAYYGKTLEARRYYDHFNGARYLSLYDSTGEWLGYINEAATDLSTNGKGGQYHSYNKYITVSDDNYEIWQNLDLNQLRNHSSDYYGETLEARGYYNHFNGRRYLSLYNNNGTWIGYINENGTKLAEGAQGNYQNYGEYVTINKDNYNIWQNFNWEQRSHSSEYYGETLEARRYYNHFNGARYLSLYDNTGEWIGYINENATRLSDS